MKTVKPQKLGLLCKAFENDGQCYFVITLLVFFPFESPESLLPEVNLWKFVSGELGKDGILDECMFKHKAEILVTGRCFTPGGTPVPACGVRVKLGSIDKTLYVVGDRRWVRGVPSDPEPFTEMPITYANAFGGAGYAPNPLGKGFAPIQGEKGEIHPLPNIEHPKHLLQSPRDKPPLAGFDPYDLMWPQRFSKVGTYDEAWLKERFPGFAKDLDWSFFNTAPEDQQIEGFFRGDETFVIENMNPRKPRIEGKLPGVSGRCFVTLKTSEGEVFREVSTQLDTIRLFPRGERGVLVFRGVTKVAEDDAADVIHLVAACEAMGEPKPVEHYQEVLKQRLDKKKGVLYSLRDRDLMPAFVGEPPPEEKSDVDEVVAQESLFLANMRRKAELDLQKAREQIKAAGLDPSKHLPDTLPPADPPTKPEDLPEVVENALEVAAKQMAEAASARVKAEADARKTCEEMGIDYDKAVSKAQKDAGGPPKFSAKAEIEKLLEYQQMARNGGVATPELDAKLADPAFPVQLFDAETRLFDMYRKLAHYFPAASALEGDPAARVREEVIASARAGESFAGRDLTGADLSGLDLKNLDFRGAMIEAGNLAGSDLRGADLSMAVLARADLTDCDLTGAKMIGTNFGAAKLVRARAGGGVDLTEAVLAKADLSHADFRGATMARADLTEAIFLETDFRDVKAPSLNFLYSSLVGLTLTGADMSKCNFIEVTLAGVDFTGAKLVSAVFVGAKGDNAIFRGATLENLRVVNESSFAGADFREAMLEGANLRGSNLAGSDFTDARLLGADLSECDLRGADFHRAEAKDARFMKADLSNAKLLSSNLMHCSFMKATIEGADFRGANLFRADLAKVRGDTETSFKDANVTQVRYVANRKPNGQG